MLFNIDIFSQSPKEPFDREGGEEEGGLGETCFVWPFSPEDKNQKRKNKYLFLSLSFFFVCFVFSWALFGRKMQYNIALHACQKIEIWTSQQSLLNSSALTAGGSASFCLGLHSMAWPIQFSTAQPHQAVSADPSTGKVWIKDQIYYLWNTKVAKIICYCGKKDEDKHRPGRFPRHLQLNEDYRDPSK